jgi:hypothetical protein
MGPWSLFLKVASLSTTTTAQTIAVIDYYGNMLIWSHRSCCRSIHAILIANTARVTSGTKKNLLKYNKILAHPLYLLIVFTAHRTHQLSNFVADLPKGIDHIAVPLGCYQWDGAVSIREYKHREIVKLANESREVGKAALA